MGTVLVRVGCALALCVNSVPPSLFGTQSAVAAISEAPVITPPDTLAAEREAVADAGVRTLTQLAPPCTTTADEAAEVPDMPLAEAADRLMLPVSNLAACCRICTVGVACGNTCISASFTCHVGIGCACNGGFSPAATPEYLRPPELSLLSQSPYPRARVGQTIQLQLNVLRLHGPAWFDKDVQLVVSNIGVAEQGLRGWDRSGLIAYNAGVTFLSDTNRFTLLVQALAPGVHRLEVRFKHKDFGYFGPDGIYWDIAVDPIPGVARLYEGWHSRWVSQSPYLVMSPGQVGDFWIRFANVGTEPWVRGGLGRQANLGLNGDDQRPYALGMAADWLWQDRIATTVAARVGPGDTAEFRFRVRAPLARGVYLLNLRPVVDGTTWLEDEGVFWVIDVR